MSVNYKVLSSEVRDGMLHVSYNIEPRSERWAKPLNERPLSVSIGLPATAEAVSEAMKSQVATQANTMDLSGRNKDQFMELVMNKLNTG